MSSSTKLQKNHLYQYKTQSFPDYAESGKGSAYLGYRLYRTAKYLSGYYSCYGDFGSFEFLPTDAAKLHRLVSGLRAC